MAAITSYQGIQYPVQELRPPGANQEGAGNSSLPIFCHHYKHDAMFNGFQLKTSIVFISSFDNLILTLFWFELDSVKKGLKFERLSS